jgi:hypothetical protein
MASFVLGCGLTNQECPHNRVRSDPAAYPRGHAGRQRPRDGSAASSPSSTVAKKRIWSPWCTAASTAPPRSPTCSASAARLSTVPSNSNATKPEQMSLERRRDADLDWVLSVPNPTPRRDTWRRPAAAAAAARTGFRYWDWIRANRWPATTPQSRLDAGSLEADAKLVGCPASTCHRIGRPSTGWPTVCTGAAG